MLLDLCVGTPLLFGSGILEKADLAALAPPILLAVLVFTLYADYAIVIDDLGLWRSFRASLHVLLRRPAASLGRHGRVAAPLVRALRGASARASTPAPRRSP